VRENRENSKSKQETKPHKNPNNNAIYSRKWKIRGCDTSTPFAWWGTPKKEYPVWPVNAGLGDTANALTGFLSKDIKYCCWPTILWSVLSTAVRVAGNPGQQLIPRSLKFKRWTLTSSSWLQCDRVYHRTNLPLSRIIKHHKMKTA